MLLEILGMVKVERFCDMVSGMVLNKASFLSGSFVLW